ncbi:MAG: hypothetical protein N2322_06175, partial [Terrimicrobiaceae bacterium]|nr:hypothetical protein [Terrimicrobiaceae bacterium]
AMARCAQRLEAEEVIEALPSSFLLAGKFEEAEARALHEASGAEIRQAEEGLIPALPPTPADFPPPGIREFRSARERSQKRLSLAAAAAAVYLGVVAGLLIVLFLGGQRAQRAQAEARAAEPEAAAAREAVTRWRILRPALDPGSFALDLLAAAAAALPSESVRFTRCAIGGGRIELAGEASDVAQTYELLERLKNSPALAEYDWTAAPPEIAGRETVRFDIQGRRPDARADTE